MKNFLENINEMKKNPKGKALLFFGFYLLFFIIVIVFLRTGTRNYTRAEDYERGNPYTFHIDKLLKSNYMFVHTITLDGVKNEYYGQRYDNTEMLEYKDKRYYSDGNNYYVNSGIWTKCDSPYLYKDFFDITKLFTLVEKASYESTTSYESGKTTYNFLISSNTINQELYGVNSDFMEEPNIITVSTNESKDVTQVILNLDSLCVNNKVCKKSLKIDLQFDMFGEVEKIESPLD